MREQAARLVNIPPSTGGGAPATPRCSTPAASTGPPQRRPTLCAAPRPAGSSVLSVCMVSHRSLIAAGPRALLQAARHCRKPSLTTPTNQRTAPIPPRCSAACTPAGAATPARSLRHTEQQPGLSGSIACRAQSCDQSRPLPFAVHEWWASRRELCARPALAAPPSPCARRSLPPRGTADWP